LAARTGLSVRGLSDLERGARVIPRKDTLRLLVEALALDGAARSALVAAAKRRSTAPQARTTIERDIDHLPMPLTPFVGRITEVSTICAILSRGEERLLTLTGPGGVGKTRLALHVARELNGWFADGVYIVDLASIHEPALVTTTIAQAFGLREMGGHPLSDRLKAFLRDKHALLLLDNFEQVAAAAPQIVRLLAACPRLTVLVTSRSVLHVSGERAFLVPPLALPDAGESPLLDQIAAAEAVQLFVDRAQAVAPRFVLDGANMLTVAAICRRLDGLPLAISLAAARVGHLTPDALHARLEQRLPLLTGGPRDHPARLRTMRDAIAWSHDLLSPPEQQLFRRLAVFAGGFTLEAAEELSAIDVQLSAEQGDREDGRRKTEDGGNPDTCHLSLVTHPPSPTTLDTLAVLVDSSLIWHDEVAGTTRFRMLETIREFGLERLEASGETDAVRRQHVEWCLSLARQSHDALPGPAQREWLERTDTEHDNIRDALSWTLAQGDPDLAQRMTASLYRFWYVRGYLSEGRAWTDRALIGAPATPTELRAGALLAAGWLTWAQGDYERAVTHVQECLSLFRDVNNRAGIAESLYILGMLAKDRDHYPEATSHLIAALDLFRSPDIPLFWIGFVLNALGLVAYELGDLKQARAWFAEAQGILRTQGETHGIAFVLTNLGRVALATNDVHEAAAHFRDCLALRHKHGDQMSIAGALRGLAIIAAGAGQFEDAAGLFGATEALRERIGLPQPRYRSRFARSVSDCRANLGDERFSITWNDGRLWPLETAVERALEVARLEYGVSG
jgi:predicted ATPase